MDVETGISFEDLAGRWQSQKVRVSWEEVVGEVEAAELEFPTLSFTKRTLLLRAIAEVHLAHFVTTHQTKYQSEADDAIKRREAWREVARRLVGHEIGEVLLG